MIKSLFAISALLLAANTSNALADGCVGSTVETKECLNDRYESADKILNLIWKNIPNKDEKLVAKQREWIKFRDWTCEEEASGEEGGSVAGIMRLSCLGRVTSERNLELARKLK